MPPVTVPIPARADRPAPGGTRVLPEQPRPSPPRGTRRSRVWLGVLGGAFATGLVTGGTLAALGVTVGSSGPGVPTATALRTVRHLGTVGSGARDVSVTFTLDNSSGVPGFTNRVTYRAVGTDEATVDLATVGSGNLRLIGAHAQVVIPAAQLARPALDTSQSGEVSRHEGFGTKILGLGIGSGDLESEAITRLSDEAKSEGVPLTAQRVAAADVRAALRRLGITTVTVTFASTS